MTTALLQARRVIPDHSSTAPTGAEGFHDDSRPHELARCSPEDRALWLRHHPDGPWIKTGLFSTP